MTVLFHTSQADREIAALRSIPIDRWDDQFQDWAEIDAFDFVIEPEDEDAAMNAYERQFGWV